VDRLNAKSEEVAPSEMEHALRREIQVKQAEDPPFEPWACVFLNSVQ
jgi:hypothetical protein